MVMCRVIVSVMTFEGEDCSLAEVGKLADHTGGRVSKLDTIYKYHFPLILKVISTQKKTTSKNCTSSRVKYIGMTMSVILLLYNSKMYQFYLTKFQHNHLTKQTNRPELINNNKLIHTTATLISLI